MPVLVILALGCAPDAPRTPAPNATPPAETASSPAPLPPSSPAASPAPPVPTAAAADWTLRGEGAGPVRFGMSLDELRAAAGEIAALGPPGECAYVVPEGAPDGLAFMVFEDRVVRADIRRGSVAESALDVRTGDSEEEALRALGPATEVTPHKYVEGHYLTTPTGEGDTFWVVETDRGEVTGVRAGLMPQVRWIEGCS